MVTIAVDAMGGDHAPKSEVEGALRAVRSLDVQVILVGREDVVRRELDHHGAWQTLPIKVQHASEVITMDDNAAKAMRTKRDSSIRVCARLVKEGLAQGLVSVGNTGAAMATSKMVLGVVSGVDRPALATPFPTVKGKPTLLVDAGANVDCSPEMLAQFAIMGEIYSRVIFKTSKPRVGILSIGEEEHKGNDLTKAATPLFKLLPINFVGNVEGRNIFDGSVDVVVCDGFVGNVVLKVSEGLSEAIRHMLKDSLSATITGQIGAVFSRSAFLDFKKRTDYSEYGGAPLLGVKGVSIIGHGRSNANAIKNAIRVAAEFAEGNVNRRIAEELSRLQLLSQAD
jgi:glycerol-3-phosphate acyltransferase PlsX